MKILQDKIDKLNKLFPELEVELIENTEVFYVVSFFSFKTQTKVYLTEYYGETRSYLSGMIEALEQFQRKIENETAIKNSIS